MTVDTAVLAPRVGDTAFITARQEVGRVVALPSETTATVVAGSGGLEVISLSEATLLPRAGALVSLPDGTGAVWLAARCKAGTLTADLLVGESVIQRSFDPSEVDPGRLVVNAETADVAGLSAALVATVAAERAACEATKKAETTLREKEASWDAWRDRLVREAHSRAEDHDYCSVRRVHGRPWTAWADPRLLRRGEHDADHHEVSTDGGRRDARCRGE